VLLLTLDKTEAQLPRPAPCQVKFQRQRQWVLLMHVQQNT
jgi:hypothetical protein